MTAPTRQKPGRARTLERGLLLLALRDLRRAPLSVLARRVGLPSSTAYRPLETLRQQGFVDWEQRTESSAAGCTASA